MIVEVYANKEGCNLNCHHLGGRIRVSKNTAYRILKKNGFRSVKESIKPGLIEAMKKAQLEFCKAHKHWTLDNWKKVIWIDETSIVLSYRQGQYRIWQRHFEKHNKTYAHSCFKNALEFIF
jgi:hypothetical protein